MSRPLRTVVSVALAAAMVSGCAVKLNGKTYGAGGGSPAGTTLGGGSPVGAALGGGSDGSDAPTTNDLPPGVRREEVPLHTPRDAALEAAEARLPPAQPADPWAAVDGDRPRRTVKPAFYFFSHTPRDCTAAHDHCLPAGVWFVESQDHIAEPIRHAQPQWFVGSDPGDATSWDLGDFGGVGFAGPVVAHRTVPATRRHLVRGALVVVQSPTEVEDQSDANDPTTNWGSVRKAPHREFDAVKYWRAGTVESIDWAAGKVRLVGHHRSMGPSFYWISATRVAVLSTTAGGTVEIRGKLRKGELAVSVAEVILPQVDKGSVADPWAEVDRDGQPKPVTDAAALEATRSVTCDAAHDHCLRPWVWFVEDHDDLWPARWDGAGFHRVAFEGTDNAKTMGYRTVPVDPARLKVGARIVFRDALPVSERDAVDEWTFGEVIEVDVAGGRFKVKDDYRDHPLAAARVPVLWWFPGEKAEKVE